MRLGKSSKRKSRSSKKKSAGSTNAEFVVGQISSNLIASVFAPKFKALATTTLENYVDDLLQYEEKLGELMAEKEANEKQEQISDATTAEEETVEITADGTIIPPQKPEIATKNENISDLVPPSRPLFHSQHVLDEFLEMMEDTAEHFSSNKGWKVHANAAKFERLLDEKYGVFRPFITNHPEIEQFLRSMQRKYAMGYFSPFRQKDLPISKTASVILLFMMQRSGNVRWDVLLLSALFLLVGLQPWALVTIVAGVQYLFTQRRRSTVGGMSHNIPLVKPYYRVKEEADTKTDTTAEGGSDEERKKRWILQPVGTKLDEKEAVDASSYDTIILGHGPAALYGAALLSRSGRKVLVLTNRPDASGCANVTAPKKLGEKYNNVPFDIEGSNVSRITQQQHLLGPALCTSSDSQGGIRFAQIGSELDGYAFEILAIPGMGTEGGKGEIPFVLRADPGGSVLMEDAATYLGDGWPDNDGEVGNSTTGAYIRACQGIQESSQKFYMSKILPEGVNDFRGQNTYKESAIRAASDFLNRCFPMNAHARSLMAGIGMRDENINPSTTSMGPHVTNICAAVSGEGMHYPIGGPRALCHALGSVVEQCGGKILTGVVVSELLFEEQKDQGKPKPSEKANDKKEDKDEECPPCVGVKLTDGREIRFSSSTLEKSSGVSPAVVSMHGFIHTFIRLIPTAIRDKYKSKMPYGLAALSERRPLFRILFALNGSAEELDLTGADFYRLPGAALAHDGVDESGVIRLGEIGWRDDKEGGQEQEDNGTEKDVSENVNKEQSETLDVPGTNRSGRDKRAKMVKGRKVKFYTGESWIKISFPSAKDPSFESRHGKVTTCVVTIEADDDFVTHFDSKPKLFSIKPDKAQSAQDIQRLLERVTKDLVELYPQLEGKIEHTELRGPFQAGLSHNPERYAAKGIRASTSFPNLFVGGSDLTVGESFAGSMVGAWLASNAVMGYTAIDLLFLQKTITSDLVMFLDMPDVEQDAPDVAVPYTPPDSTSTESPNPSAPTEEKAQQDTTAKASEAEAENLEGTTTQ